jgi:hypothetical protein
MGIEDAIKDAIGITSDKDLLNLIKAKPFAPLDSKTELLNLIKELNLKIEINDSKDPVDPIRKATAISSNVKPLDIENPIDVLWEIGQRFKGEEKYFKGNNSGNS